MVRQQISRTIAFEALVVVTLDLILELEKRYRDDPALAGKPKEAFYDIPDIDHSEKAREQYERVHYSTCVELDREGHG